MAQVVALPARGAVFLDARGEGRALRVSWHAATDGAAATSGEPGEDTVVLSLWRQDHCVATFRLARVDVPALVDALVHGLAAGPAGHGHQAAG